MSSKFISHKKKIFLISLSCLIALVMLSCNLLTSLFGSEEDLLDFEEIMLTNTQLAFEQTATEFAKPAVQIFLTQTQEALDAPTRTPIPSRTQTATEFDTSILTATNTKSDQTLTNTPVLAPTFTPTVGPTNTVGPTFTPSPVPPTPTPRVSGEMENRIRNAKVLILEDIACDQLLIPRINSAVQNLGMNTELVHNYNCATGDFIETLNAGEDWDLIIVATEQRTEARLDIWEALYDYAMDGTAIVIEAWYLEEIQGGTIAPLLEECGVRVHADWHRKVEDEAYTYVVYDVASNNHEIFNRPAKVEVPMIPRFYWADDVGDLIEVLPDSHGTAIIGGLHKSHSTYYGLITECLNKRMILQTFSTHNYKKVDTISLWQNYIYNTLLAHFEYMDSQP